MLRKIRGHIALLAFFACFDPAPSLGQQSDVPGLYHGVRVQKFIPAGAR